MKNNTIREKIFYVLAISTSIFLLFAFIGSVWIGHEAKSLCQDAKSQYGGSCTEALIKLLDDEHQGYRQRNHAIWALGQLGDSQAQPILEKYYTGNIPDREPLDETISQYELQKALKLVRGETNISAFIWKNLL